jgi:phage gpG-like protein
LVATRSAAFDWSIQNQDAFDASLKQLGKVTSDFRIPLRIIASDFYRSQKKLFTLQSAGLYPPLGGNNFSVIEANGLTRRRNAEDRKEKLTGHPWAPILFGKSGDLRDSTLTKNHRFSVFFLGRQELQIGTNVPYGKFHQSDEPRRVMPDRKFVFIDGGPADRSADSNINGRRERWTNIIEDHIKQLVTGKVL